MLYSKFFDKKSHIPSVIVQISMLWVSLCVIYIFKIKLEISVMVGFISHIRYTLFEQYIKSNEYNFNDTTVPLDVAQILEVCRQLREIFYWACQTSIPTILVFLSINLYFLVKFPKIAIINIIGVIIIAYITIVEGSDLVISSNKRELEYLKISDKTDENFNNLMNIFLNDKIEDTINENKKITEKFNSIFIHQQNCVELFVRKLKITTYSSTLMSLIVLYRNAELKTFIDILFIFTFYIGVFENMLEDVPYFITTIGNLVYIENIMTAKEVEEPIFTENLDNFNGEISFQNVSFAYPLPTDQDHPTEKHVGKNILQNFSLNIHRGNRLSIMSQSGSGKSTIMKLLLGFYKPRQGMILLDGKGL
jgi:ABC-type multidrug transport system fused ATPase/permease subunit